MFESPSQLSENILEYLGRDGNDRLRVPVLVKSDVPLVVVGADRVRVGGFGGSDCEVKILEEDSERWRRGGCALYIYLVWAQL